LVFARASLILLKSPANAAHLSKSIEQYNSGQVKSRDLIDG